MRKVLYLTMFMIVLGACGVKKHSDVSYENHGIPLPPPESEVQEGDFVYRLYTEKDVYDTLGGTAIFAELTYIGEQDEIEIAHASSPFYFPLEERTRKIHVDYAMNSPLIVTTLKKDVPHQHRYEFAGGYSDQDDPDYVEFVKTIIEEKGFPEGEYIIHGAARFTVAGQDDDMQDLPETELATDIGFRVVDPIK
ncbi:hypothetical protein OXB_3214 [Bacillus sp. OxB-1]|uniref:hypothetical protein n=1 Tax=Bacillus sp. (strain OxB-1) TaxID=98228 RepID=UPI000581E5F6|nr:hypothetical protein [Bacillus sp. OxB-1]BAQ11683.1 hypothetical protein OXB_3214 [Bacillus sp. OxB-1]